MTKRGKRESAPDGPPKEELAAVVPSFGPEERRFLARAVVLAIVVRLFFFLAVVMVGRISVGHRGSMASLLADRVVYWDGINYRRIASLGPYDMLNNQGGDITFFPLYPLCLHIVMSLLRMSFLVGSACLSVVTQIAAGYLLQRLLAFDRDEAHCGRALALFYLFPTAYFLVAPYTEGLFLTLVLAAMLAARQHAWGWAGAAAFAAALCRTVGIAVWPALVWEAWRAPRRGAALCWSLLGPVGSLSYLALNYLTTGDPWYFLWVQQHLFNFTFAWPWVTCARLVGTMLNSDTTQFEYMINIPQLLGLVSTYGVLVWQWRACVRPSYQWYNWVALVPATLTSFSPSLPRYLLAAFPLYHMLADRERAFVPCLCLFALLMGALTVDYASGFWAF